jgi:hypothetical protein
VRADVDSGDGDDAVSFADGLAGAVELGPGADRGTSSGRPGAFLRGGPGDDVLTGGDDLVDPGPGRDQVQSLGGADRLLLRDGEHDDASWGTRGRRSPTARISCCAARASPRPGAARVTLSTYPAWFSGRSLGVHLLCSIDLRKGCSGRVTVRVGGRLAGRGRFALRADAEREAPIALRRFARLRVLAAGRMRVALRVDTRDARGHPIVLHAHATAYRA